MAELQGIMENNDFTVELTTTTNLNNKPDRTQIDNVLIENGYTLPLANNVAFSMVSGNGKYFFMKYLKDIDKFMYVKAQAV